MEQNRESRNRHIHMWLINIWQENQEHKGENVVPSVNDSHVQKNEMGPQYYTTHRHYFKMV